MAADDVAVRLAEIRAWVEQGRSVPRTPTLTIALQHLAFLLDLIDEAADWAKQATERLDAVKALHKPEAEGGMGFLPNGGYGYIAPACVTCGTFDEYAVPWPCPTIRALDGEPVVKPCKDCGCSIDVHHKLRCENPDCPGGCNGWTCPEHGWVLCGCTYAGGVDPKTGRY